MLGTPAPTTTPPPAYTDEQTNQKYKKDCLSCRLIGTGALGGTGVYALYQSRRAAPGSPAGKGITALVGVALICLGAGRFFQ